MMEHMEMVEKLREKANITIEEAKVVLEKNNWDMLDALIELERQGKIADGVKMSTENQNSAAYERSVRLSPDRHLRGRQREAPRRKRTEVKSNVL